MEVVGIVRIIISPGGFLIGRQVVSRNVDVNGAQGTDPCAQHHLHLRTGWRVAAPRTPFHGRWAWECSFEPALTACHAYAHGIKLCVVNAAFAHVPPLHEVNVFMLPKCTLFSRSLFFQSPPPLLLLPPPLLHLRRLEHRDSEREKEEEEGNETIPKIPEHSGRAFVHTDEQLKPEQRFFSPLSFVCLLLLLFHPSSRSSFFFSLPLFFRVKAMWHTLSMEFRDWGSLNL